MTNEELWEKLQESVEDSDVEPEDEELIHIINQEK